MKNKFEKLPEITGKAFDAIKLGVFENHPVTNLEQLGANQKLINILQSNGIATLDELTQKRKEDLLSIPNFGERQLNTLFKALSNYHKAK